MRKEIVNATQKRLNCLKEADAENFRPSFVLGKAPGVVPSLSLPLSDLTRAHLGFSHERVGGIFHSGMRWIRRALLRSVPWT
jgi:hypothetical protein